MTQMGFYFDQTRCTGCYACGVACKDWHDIDAGPVSLLRVKTIEDGEFPDPFVAHLVTACHHCANPPCVSACPEHAIDKGDADGIVRVDREKCKGNTECLLVCLKACPWEAPQFGAEAGAKMLKCDLCFERLAQGKQPICVEACPMYALEAGPLEDLKAKHLAEPEATGFHYSPRFKPSIVFRPKRNQKPV
jgi:anaerobic dimethyl sulfoxide reductase subunit B (iron-sulfur subunit)